MEWAGTMKVDQHMSFLVLDTSYERINFFCGP